MFADNCYNIARVERSYYPNTVLPITEKYYDAFDRLRLERLYRNLNQQEVNLALTKYNYDEFGRLIEVINPENQKTWYWYDDYGRIKHKYHPDLGSVSYRYDKLGNVRFSQTEKQVAENRITFL